MADVEDQNHPNLHLSPDERRLFGQLFSAADTEKIGVVTGEVAVKFFERTRLSPAVLGEIWQIADVENRGLLTPPGFGIVLRLIGYAQAGRQVSAELSLKPGGPLPRFDGITTPTHPNAAPSPLQPQQSGGPIRVPPLAPDKVAQYSALFEESGAQNGLLSGETAKQIFERSHLPNDVLGRIWSLADTEQKGELGLTEFIIAMHLLASYRNGTMRALPQILPAGLYEAASRRGQPRQPTGSRPASGATPSNSVGRHFSGSGFPVASSPESRPAYPNTQLPAAPRSPASDEWAVSSRDKENFDQIYATVDTANRGYITGDQAVGFFNNSKLPEDALAQIWDLADINSEGRLNRDEFAVAMFLIRQQRTKQDGRDVLPPTLPPNLIPPSMRRRAVAPPQATAPVFDSAAKLTGSRSATEDLFGLDDFTSHAQQIPHTSDDSALYSSTPPPGQVSPQIPPPIQQSSTFKPFVPSSSFGQAMMTPQSTGFPNRSGIIESPKGPQQPLSAADDLLGDNDPEVSKKLTQETTELANLSNQVSNLSGKMQEVKSKTVSTEQDFSKTQAQKRDFEVRLSQLRSAYEQEVLAVKALDEQLLSSRSEIKKLEHDMALIDVTYQDLQHQHRQTVDALDTDQKENSRLKEQIRLTNAEISELKPQLEKMKSELRHQKGLVTINKKQLAINESERERLKADLQGTSKELDDTTREIEGSARILETNPEPKPAAATSPPSSSSNMNPFFRRTPTLASEKGVSSPFTPQNMTSPNHDAFDSFFGPAVGSSNPQSGPPPTSFRTGSPSNVHGSSLPPVTSTQSVKSSEGPDLQTPSDSPLPSIKNDSPKAAGVPPAPPQSRQMTSSFLPLRNLQRTDSTSSSVRVVPPASRMGDSPGFGTPTDRQPSLSGSPEQEKFWPEPEDLDAKPTKADDLPSLAATQKSPRAASRNTELQDQPSYDGASHYPVQSSAIQEIPGAFPGDSTPPAQPNLFAAPQNVIHPVENPIQPSTRQVHDPFGSINEQPKTPTSIKDDFNAAFEGFGKASKLPERSNGTAIVGPAESTGLPKARGEFPPIEDIGADDDSESEYSDRGFDDNFTAASPRRTQAVSDETEASFPQPPTQSNLGNYLAPSRPHLSTNESNQSQLPTPGAQVSPPTYDQTVTPHNQAGQPNESNPFPAEYIGLLPSREHPISPPTSPPSTIVSDKVGSPVANEKGPDLFGSQVQKEPSHSSSLPPVLSPLPPGASAAPYAYEQNPTKPKQTQSQSPIPAKTALADDFDNEFGDLSEAKEADDKADDEFTSAPKGGFDEFNPVFDSPTPARSAAYPSVGTFSTENDFRDFESNIAGPNQTSNSRHANDQAPSSSGHDWDAIFAGLETPQNNGVQADPKPTRSFGPEIPPQAVSSSAAQPSKPQLPRGLSTGTDHDDPILKRLTGMGYARDVSLKALEKFDYNIDMAADYLASKS